MDVAAGGVLRVGFGNSQFVTSALRVAPIDGSTIRQPERKPADCLGIDDYRVSLFDKYMPEALDYFK